jgi:hypothetical protein
VALCLMPSSEASRRSVGPAALPQPDSLPWSCTAFQSLWVKQYRLTGLSIPLRRFNDRVVFLLNRAAETVKYSTAYSLRLMLSFEVQPVRH